MTNRDSARHHAAEAWRLLKNGKGEGAAQAHATLALYYQGESDPPQQFGAPLASEAATREPVRAILARRVGERITPSLVEHVKQEVAAAGYDGVVTGFPEGNWLEYRPADHTAIIRL